MLSKLIFTTKGHSTFFLITLFLIRACFLSILVKVGFMLFIKQNLCLSYMLENETT